MVSQTVSNTGVMTGVVYNPTNTRIPDGQFQPFNLYGAQGEQIDSDLHGRYWNAAIRKNVFKFFRSNVVFPAVAATVVSKFALYNPPTSGVIAEIIHTDVSNFDPLNTTNTVGWYASWGAAAQGNLNSLIPAVGLADGGAVVSLITARVGDIAAPACLAYRSITYTVIPVRVDIVLAVPSPGAGVYSLTKDHQGTLLLLPGGLISLLWATTADAANYGLSVTWSEWPYL